VGVAKATTSSARHHDTIASADQISGEPVARANVRTKRHWQNQILTRSAVLPRTFAVPAAVRPEMPTPGELEQRRHALPGYQVHATSTAPVATVGPTERHVLFTPKRHDAISAVPSFYPDACFVDVDCHAC
jgi:hypothetical protein